MLVEGGVGLRVFDTFTEFDDPAKLADAQARARRGADRLLQTGSPPPTSTGASRPTAARTGSIPERIGDLLAHLFLHEIHHRGQVHAMLSGTSVKPPQLDEFFLDFDTKLRREEIARLELAG